MDNRGQTGELILFRQAATSMSAGVLLAAVSLTPTVAYMGFFFALVSIPLIIAAGLQPISKANKLCEYARRYGESLTFSLILISILSIILKWEQIVGASVDLTTTVTPNFIQFFFKHIPLWFVLAFGVVLLLVQFSDIIKIIKHKLGLKQTLIKLILTAALLGGLYIVSSLPFTYEIEPVPKVILLVVWSLYIPICLYYLSSKSRVSEEINLSDDSLEMIRL